MKKEKIKSLIKEAERLKKNHNYEKALAKLEEAHLLAQENGWEHLVVHCEMFMLALEYRKLDELLGQIPRILLAYPGSVVRRYPKGNVGSTKMGIFETRE